LDLLDNNIGFIARKVTGSNSKNFSWAKI